MLTRLFDVIFRRALFRDAFARRYMACLRESGLSGSLVYEPDAFRIVTDYGIANLDNAYRAYRQAPRGQRKAVIVRYAALMPREHVKDRSWDEVRDQLRPVIRSRGSFVESSLDVVLKKGWDAYHQPVGRPWGEDCFELLAVDAGEVITTFTNGPSKAWNVSLDQALGMARTQLRDVTPNAFREHLPGVYIGAWSDGYDSSRVLLPDVVHRAPVGGSPVFMIPTRDVVLVASASDESALRRMARSALEFAWEGRVVSAGMYTYHDANVVSFPLKDPEVRCCLDELRRDIDQEQYAQQKRVLDKINQALGEDVFVATCLRATYRDASDVCGATPSYLLATWTEGIATSLPKADRIAFVVTSGSRAGDTLVVDWSAAMPLLGDLLSDDRALYPPRFKVNGFPPEDVLRQLEAIRTA
ncbi:DUF1444 family protein [uncultured Pseudoxanthomonas sp.]|uniref:DUF1444 family protein n=1 Tax=uncultured Pseudoxanthomonas sp. TaxID=281701 RepID=UPI002591D9DC|nr:DUF1444 family protein [uncultured Pseudoxanthomonas sp.]